MATPDYTALIRQLHLIYLGRQAMPDEHSAMAAQLAAANAPATIGGLAGAYASSPAVAAIIDGLANGFNPLKPPGDSPIAIVKSAYSTLFGRSVDFDGLVYWATAIEQGGLGSNVAPLAILAGAQENSSSQSQADSAGLAARTSISEMIDLFALNLAPTLPWMVNSPYASFQALFAVHSLIPAAAFVNQALIAYGVVKPVSFDSKPITFPPTPIAPVPPPITVSMDAPSMREGNGGQMAMAFHLTLNAAQSSNVEVYFATMPGSAGTGDFQSTAGRIVFAAGQTSATVNVLVAGDHLLEQNETFSLIVGGSGIVGAEAIGTIINDDVAVPLTLVGYHPALLF
jgi:hypothetical protein